MKQHQDVPSFVVVITLLLGCYDLLRGVMHTIFLNYSALHIAGLDLSSATASDQLRLLGAFGISNYETGIALILMGLYAQRLALAMLGVIPLLYLLGYFTIKINIAGYEPSNAHWGGVMPLMVYMGISVITFLLGMRSLLKSGG
ncbi:MAG: hypothetical protein WCO47_00830 [Methylococcus sp.]|jgi:hypothetical protein